MTRILCPVGVSCNYLYLGLEKTLPVVGSSGPALKNRDGGNVRTGQRSALTGLRGSDTSKT